MSRLLIITTILIIFSGCISTPYAHIGASKTINVGGIDVGVGVGDIINLGK